MKTINLLGSTGSIGVQSLDVARARGYKVEALAAFSDVEKIEQQIREFKPEYAALVDEKAANDLKRGVISPESSSYLIAVRNGLVPEEKYEIENENIIYQSSPNKPIFYMSINLFLKKICDTNKGARNRTF